MLEYGMNSVDLLKYSLKYCAAKIMVIILTIVFFIFFGASCNSIYHAAFYDYDIEREKYHSLSLGMKMYFIYSPSLFFSSFFNHCIMFISLFGLYCLAADFSRYPLSDPAFLIYYFFAICLYIILKKYVWRMLKINSLSLKTCSAKEIVARITVLTIPFILLLVWIFDLVQVLAEEEG